MVRSSCIIIVSGMGDDVPILGAVVTLFVGDGLMLFLMMFLYMSMVRSSHIIIVSSKRDDVPILGAVVTLFGGDGFLLFFFNDISWMVYFVHLVNVVIWSSGNLLIW